MKNPSRTSSAASASTASTSESTSDHQQHVLPHALRSQLGQLLPKHALFQVHVKVEQLSNVPLISGQFAMRWKFKNVQSRSGLLSKMKANRSWPSRNKGKGRATDVGLAIEVTPAEEEVDSYVEDDTGDGSSPEYDGTDDESYRRRASSGDFPQEPETAVPPVTPTPGIVQQAPSTSSAPEQRPGEPRSVARGVTPWRPLQNYNVKMNYDVNVLVQMDVHRETSALLPNELKLVVMQRVIPGDPNSPQQPRLGAVYLNLAEYADAGPVTRRYLLRKSKTNATLKLMIELEYVGGVKHYRPPPLRKGEIMASVTGLLSNNDLLRTSIARELDEYTHDMHPHEHAFMHSDGSVDGDALATYAGLRSTEDLIETLFNPLPTAASTSSPFTYYAPLPPAQAEQRDDASSDSLSLTQASVRSDSTGAVSIEKLPVESLPDLTALETGRVPSEGQRTWWRKIRSRPNTPAQRQFKLPVQEAEVARA